MAIGIKKKGQSAVIDAVIFFAIMMVVLASLIYMARAMTWATGATKTYHHASFAKATLQTVLMSTINKAYYNDSEGNTIVLEDKSIQELIVEDLYLRKHYSDKIDVRSLESGIESKINRTIYNLTWPAYNYHFWAAMLNDDNVPSNPDLHLGNDFSRWGSDIYCESIAITVPQSGEHILVTLYVWLR